MSGVKLGEILSKIAAAESAAKRRWAMALRLEGQGRLVEAEDCLAAAIEADRQVEHWKEVLAKV